MIMRFFLGVMLVTGCFYAPVVRSRVEHKTTSSEVRIRTVGLPGTGELADNGTAQFALDLDRVCQRFGVGEDTTFARSSNRLSKGFWLFLAGTAAATATGIVVMANTEPDSAPFIIGGVLPTTFGGVTLLFGGLLAPLLKDIGSLERRVGTRIVTEPTVDARCSEAQPIAKLTLVTPWGATVDAKPAPDGRASFAIDWSDERIGAVESQLTAPFKVNAGGLSTTWVASERGRQVAAEQVAKLRDRVVTGATPPALASSLSSGAGGLVVGGKSQLVLRIENRGASTAIDVRARTRSSIAVLHGLVFDFGKVQPGKAAVRALPIAIPGDTTGEDATVLITFEERGGNAPADLRQKLPLIRSVCPDGKLTRAQYDEGRKQLKQRLDEGKLGQPEFDAFDDQLLRCLE